MNKISLKYYQTHLDIRRHFLLKKTDFLFCVGSFLHLAHKFSDSMLWAQHCGLRREQPRPLRNSLLMSHRERQGHKGLQLVSSADLLQSPLHGLVVPACRSA
jgi:hypothetical protein